MENGHLAEILLRTIDVHHCKHRYKTFLESNGCGSVGRAVASDSRGPQFESHHRQKNYIEEKRRKKTTKKESIPRLKY